MAYRERGDRSRGVPRLPTNMIKSPSGLTLVDMPTSRVHSEEPKVIVLSIGALDPSGISSSWSKSDEWDAIPDFYGDIYPTIQRSARNANLQLDSVDIAAGIEEGWISDWITAAQNLAYVANVKETADKLQTPLLREWSTYVYQRRFAMERQLDRLASFPIPPIYRELVDYVMTPVMHGPESPIIMASMNKTRAVRDLSSTTDVEDYLGAAETAMDSLENSADKIKFLNALQAFKPNWTGPLKVSAPVVDPDRALMWRTRAIRNTNGVTDRQNPNLEDTLSFGRTNGDKVPIITYGSPNPLRFTALIPNHIYKSDDKGTDAYFIGGAELIGNSSDDADQPSEMTVVTGRSSPVIQNRALNYAQSVSDIGKFSWLNWLYAARTFQDNPTDWFTENIFDNMQYYEYELEDMARETRRMLIQSWMLPL